LQYFLYFSCARYLLAQRKKELVVGVPESVTQEEQYTSSKAVLLLDRLSREIHEEIDAVQNPSQSGRSCETAPVLVIDVFESGFGGQLGYYINHLMSAMRQERVLIIRGNWGYASGCPFGEHFLDYRCFFLPFSPCTVENALNPTSGNRVIGSRGASDFYHDEVDMIQNYPKRYRSLGIPFWRTQITQKFIRLQPQVKARLLEAKRSLLWPTEAPVIALHIRRGDKVNEGYEMYPLSNYLTEVLAIQKKFGAEYLFVATDSPTELENILHSPSWTNTFRILYHNDSFREGDNRNEVGVMASNSKEAGYQLGLDALVNIFLISEANFFVGTVHSNLGRMGAEWMYTKFNLLGPMRFVDKEKCLLDRHHHPDIEAYSSFNRDEFLRKVWDFYHH
jgi:hypothetical protein